MSSHFQYYFFNNLKVLKIKSYLNGEEMIIHPCPDNKNLQKLKNYYSLQILKIHPKITNTCKKDFSSYNFSSPMRRYQRLIRGLRKYHHLFPFPELEIYVKWTCIFSISKLKN